MLVEGVEVKILIHSNAPWQATGYGKQTALLIPRLVLDGHEVVVSCVSGLDGGSVKWSVPQTLDVIRCLPRGQFDFGIDTLPAYIEDERPDLVLTIMDCRMLAPVAEHLSKISCPLWSWVPSDTSPLSRPELAYLTTSKARPLAMSRFAERLLLKEGLASDYAPHMVDTTVFTSVPEPIPGVYGTVWPGDPNSEREDLGIPEDAFVIGMVAANHDAIRKGFPEQFEAFRRHREVNKKAYLVVHTIPQSSRGMDLFALASDLGIGEHTSFAPPLPQITGRLDDRYMARLYRSFDVLSACSYAEGFGVPLLEAQACGTPVVTTSFGAMEELGRLGFRVGSEPFWNPVHRAWWGRPNIDEIAAGYAYFAGAKHPNEAYRVRVTESVQQFDADTLYASVWRPLLAEVSG